MYVYFLGTALADLKTINNRIYNFCSRRFTDFGFMYSMCFDELLWLLSKIFSIISIRGTEFMIGAKQGVRGPFVPEVICLLMEYYDPDLKTRHLKVQDLKVSEC